MATAGSKIQRRVNHVAEIQNAADRLAAGIHQQVAGVAVAMNGLTAQAAQAGQTGPKGARNPLDGFPQRAGASM